MNYKIKLFFVNCIILCSLSLIIVKAVNNYFCVIKQESIKFFDQNEYEREWLSQQTKFKRYDIYVMSKDHISESMKLHGIDGITVPYSTPSYNAPNGSHVKNLYYYLANPSNGLLGVYLKPRLNIFNKTYPINDNQHTLDDLLKHEIAIEEAYIFWDANKKEVDPNVFICHQNFIIYDDQNNNNYKEESIKNYLYDKKITNEKKYVKLNCYNLTPNSGIVRLFKPGEYEDEYYYSPNIEAVYFDDGFRFADPNIEINYLVKLSNGAKNIYLFSFDIIERQKKVKYIELSDLKDPYEAIQKWINDNKFDVSSITKESNYEWKLENDVFNLTKTIETKDTIYHLNWNYNFLKKFNDWKDQCYVKPNTTNEEMRQKIGRYSTTVYDSEGHSHTYYYEEHWYGDSWGITGFSSRSSWETVGKIAYPVAYYAYNVLCPEMARGYFDTTKPPTKEEIIQNLNKHINENLNKQSNEKSIQNIQPSKQRNNKRILTNQKINRKTL